MAQTYTITAPAKPGLTPPPNVTPNFNDPGSIAPYLILTIMGCIVTTTILVAARVYTKVRLIKKVNWEDYTCCIGWASFMVYLGIQYSISQHGGGVHQWNLSYEDFQYNNQWTNYGDVLYSIALFFTKLSLLLLILRIFLSVQRGVLWWLTVTLMVINGIFYTIFFLVPIFQCSPRAKIWNQDMPGHCLQPKILYLASAIFNMVSDTAMLSVPIYLIWNLQMSIQRKIGLSLIFGTGTLACVASMLRLSFTVNLIKSKDYTFIHVQTLMWACAEIAFGLACSCFPILPRLYQHISSIAPYSGGSSHMGIQNGSSTKATVSAAAKHSLNRTNKGRANGSEWIHLDDRNIPGLPPKTTVHVEHRTEDEDTLEEAVAGKDASAEGGDLEKGRAG